ncbi:hypothetical protein RJ639_010226 [Escallonia herrerae]|uniref:DUF4378 domain-containing protein n=1 Tax=Escallonia herrerae TaxID=1293975 RepID=A0AA88VPT6_9ASTE|nr:hypothetical protein RJ639_010226 [Escallonia herrerae]
MGHNFLRIDHAHDKIENNQPGCAWGILHALDYHQWHYNVKRMLLHKKHDKQRHAKRTTNQKTRLDVHDSNEEHKLSDAEASHFHRTTGTSSINKMTLKARIKALVANDFSEREGHKQHSSGFPRRSRLRRTYSIHHLETSDYTVDEISSDCPIIILQKNDDRTDSSNRKFDLCGAEELAKNYSLHQKKHGKARETSVSHRLEQGKNASLDQLQECVDVLELFKVNKDLFQKLLQNTDDVIADRFDRLKAPNNKRRLTKAGSFPVADLVHFKNFRPSTLEQKQSENWSSSKGERLLPRTAALNVVASRSSKDVCANSGPLTADDSDCNVLHQKINEELDQQVNNEVVMSLKATEKKNEIALKEGKFEDNCTFVDALFDEVSAGRSAFIGPEEIDEGKESTSMGNGKEGFSYCCETDGSVYNLSKHGVSHIRRTSSLRESLDRYARLFEVSFSREVKPEQSKSLKLTKEYEIPLGGQAPISLKRIRSLSHLDFFSSFQNEESSDSHLLRMPITNVVDDARNVGMQSQDEPNTIGYFICTAKDAGLDASETEYLVGRSDDCTREGYSASLTVDTYNETASKMGVLREETVESTIIASNSHNEMENSSTSSSIKIPQPDPLSARESCFKEITGVVAFPGLECGYFNGKKSTNDSLIVSDTDFRPESCSKIFPENVEHENNRAKKHKNTDVYGNDDASFSYVREILERSGFIGNGLHGAWHLSDQPLNPSLFEELEGCWRHETDYPGEDISPCLRHLLLFDLVNEVYLQIYERSFAYYPRALSTSCRTRPLPVGDHIIEEVWTSIRRSLTVKPEMKQSLDSVMAQDMAKDDGWMNLQWESECVALDLEDLIFDELLEEALCSSAV